MSQHVLKNDALALEANGVDVSDVVADDAEGFALCPKA
jgi:hypothetical protein